MKRIQKNTNGMTAMKHLLRALVLLLVIAGINVNETIAQGGGPNTSWNGSVSSDWFDADNWSNGVPGPGRRVTIGWVNPANHMPVINAAATMQRLTMQSNNNTLTLHSGAELIVTDNFSISNTSTLIADNASLHVEGNLTSQGTIDFFSGDITVDGNLAISGTTASSDFGTTNVTVNGSFSSTGNAYFGDATFNANGGFSVGNDQSFYLNGGILNINSASSLGGNLIIDQGGTVNVYADFTIGASSNLTLIDGSINFYENSIVTGSGNFNAIAGDVYFGEDVIFNGSGAFSAGEATVMVDGSNWSMTGGASMDPGTSTFIFSGDTQLITGSGGIDEITFYNLMILDDSDVFSEIDVIVLNDMTVDDDSDFVTDPDATLNVIGDVIGDPFIDSDNPYIISIASINVNTILVVFDDELDAASAENNSNYQVEDQAAPTAAVLGGANNNEVTLTLGFTMMEDTQYFLIVNNIENTSGGVISLNHRKRFGITEPIDEIDLDDANQALDEATVALNDYLEAGGADTDQVYTDVVDAIAALEDAINADPQVQENIDQATTVLVDALESLATATEGLAGDLIAAAHIVKQQYLELGGDTNAVHYTELISAIDALQNALDADPQDFSVILAAMDDLDDAINNIDAPIQQLLIPQPSTTTAVISEGMAGEPTTITVTVRNSAGVPLEGHISLLTANLSGTNDGQALSGPTEIGDGVYAFTYTPEIIGDDVLEVYLDGAAIQGSPYTTSVAAGMPAILTILQHPTEGTAGLPLTPASVVEVRDAFNNPVEGALIHAVINKNAFCGLCESSVSSDVNGIATFNNLLINVADEYQISFRTEGSGGIDVFSGSFDLVLDPNVAAQAVIISGPTTSKPGQISKYFTLTLTDEFGNESYFLDDAQFILSSTSNSVEFIPEGSNPNNPSDILEIGAGISSRRFRYRDWNPGFQIITADFDSFIFRNQDSQQIFSTSETGNQNRFFTPGEYEIEVTDSWVWTALAGNGQDDDWTNSANWNMLNGTPQDGDEVILRTFHADIAPRINGVTQLQLDRLIIQGNLPVTLQPGTQLTVNSIVDLNGGYTSDNETSPLIRIESTPDGTGSFIQQDAGVAAIVERYISGVSNAWHQLSSPILSQQVSGGSTDFMSGGVLYTWYEPAQSWVAHDNTSNWPTWPVANQGSDALIPGRGYMAAFSDNPTKTFEGVLNFGDIEYTLHRYAHPDDLYVGYNMAGNPYASSVDWDHNEWSGQDNLESPAIWIWNDVDGQYGVYDSRMSGDLGTRGVSRYIAPMQGFWVLAGEGSHGKRLGMNNDVRTHSDQEWRNSHQDIADLIRLHVSGTATTYRDELILEFNHSAAGSGARKMFSMYEEAPSLYAHVNDENYSIGFHGPKSSEAPVSVHFESGAAGYYEIGAETTGHQGRLVLEDLFTGTLHDLGTGTPYLFQAQPSDPSDRFLLHTGDDATTDVTAPDADSHIHIYSHEEMLYLRTNGYETRLAVFDVQGRQVMSDVLYGEGLHTIPLNLRPGVYVVRAINGNAQKSTKIIQQ